MNYPVYTFTFTRDFSKDYTPSRAERLKDKFTITEILAITKDCITREQRGCLYSDEVASSVSPISKYDYRLTGAFVDGKNILNNDAYILYKHLVSESVCRNTFPDNIKLMNNLSKEQDTELTLAYDELLPSDVVFGLYNDHKEEMNTATKTFSSKGEEYYAFIEDLVSKEYIRRGNIKTSLEKDREIVKRMEGGELLPDLVSELYQSTPEKTVFDVFYERTSLPLGEIMREHFSA